MKLLLAFACSLPLSFAFAEGRATYGGQAQVSLPSAVVRIDPLSPAAADAEIAALVFDAPYRLEGGVARPHLAVSVDEGPSMRARLRIRTDVKWHDGKALRAADVAASLARGLRDPRGWALGPIRGARAIAEDTVEVELSRPTPDLALLLATPAAAVTQGGLPPEARAIGTGPFAVEGGEPPRPSPSPDGARKGDAGAVRLAAFPGCFAGRPFLDALTLRPFPGRLEESQSFELGTLAAARHASARRGAQVLESAPAVVGWLAIGKQAGDRMAGPLREALALGVDRERLRRLVREKSVAFGVAAPDPARARALLDRSWPGERRLALVFDQSQPDDRAVAERLIVELSRLGLDLTIEALDAPTYHRRLAAQEFSLALGASAPPAPGLEDLALLAVVDPLGARDRLAHAPAAPIDLALTRVVPLYRRAARVVLGPELAGLKLDGAGRPSWADAWLRKAR